MNLNSLPDELIAGIIKHTKYATLARIRKIDCRFDALAKKYDFGVRIPITAWKYCLDEHRVYKNVLEIEYDIAELGLPCISDLPKRSYQISHTCPADIKNKMIAQVLRKIEVLGNRNWKVLYIFASHLIDEINEKFLSQVAKNCENFRTSPESHNLNANDVLNFLEECLREQVFLTKKLWLNKVRIGNLTSEEVMTRLKVFTPELVNGSVIYISETELYVVSEVQGSANRAATESTFQREEVKRMRDNIGDLRGKLGDLEGKNALLESEVKQLNYQLSDDQRQYEQALNDRDATLSRMREECQALVQELQGLLDTKQMLDAEIAIYRKMLEGEESRVGLRQMVEQVVKTHSLQQQEDTDSTRSVRGEVSTKTTFQRSAEGNVTIAECDPNGKYITLENTHRTKDENLREHKLKRKLDGNNKREIVYTIPANTVLKAGKTMKIYARDQGGIHSPPDSLVFDAETTWGIGANVVTTLYNKEGDERAAHNQKTIQTGQ